MKALAVNCTLILISIFAVFKKFRNFLRISPFIAVLSLPLQTKASECKPPPVPEVFQKAQEDVESQIEKWSQTKLIASQADSTLSQLLKAKSPVILSWLQKRGLNEASEEQIVKEWRAYYAKNFVLSKYPHTDSKLNKEIEKLVNGLIKAHFDKKFEKRIRKSFTEAKKLALAKIQSFKLKEEPQIQKRLSAIKLHWPKKLTSTGSSNVPLEIIHWGVAYNPPKNEINIGLESLAYADDNTLLAVLVHEMGHAIDSCRWGAFFTGPWPFEKIGQCLRSDKSVAAKKRDDSQMQSLQSQGKLSADLVTGMQLNPTCNKGEYPPVGLQADQLPEAFADWFSAEVMAEVKTSVASSIRSDLCADRELIPGSSYPTNSDRLQKIYRAHPRFRMSSEKLADSVIYCTLEQPSARE